MSRAQIILLGVAIAAALGAFLLWQSEPVTRIVQTVQTEPMDQVLVAERDLGYGVRIDGSLMKWVDWPRRILPPGAITRSAEPDAQASLDGSYVKQPLSGGELIRKDRLIKGAVPGLMSSMVSPGRRAVGIDVSPAGTAGGFVLPDDRVDVFGVFRSAESSGEGGAGGGFASRIVVSNVRVLAVGSSTEKKPIVDAQRVQPTVTLELTPTQTQCVLEAQKTGPLSLVVRSISESAIEASTTGTVPTEQAECGTSTGSEMTMVRRGVVTTLHAK